MDDQMKDTNLISRFLYWLGIHTWDDWTFERVRCTKTEYK